MSSLRLTFLGTFQAFLDGQPLTTFRSSKVQGLLAYLVLEVDRPHSRDLLASMFWPEQTDQVARKNLRQSLYQLRQVLEDTAAADDEQFLAVTRSQVQFNRRSAYELDTELFVTHAENGRWPEAAALYHGDLLPGFTCDSLPFEEWLRQGREHLHNIALDSFYEAAQFYLDRGSYELAEDFAILQLKLEAWREEAYQQLMLALASRGERSAALAQYEQCVAILKAELGVEPSEKTVLLYEEIKTGEIKPLARASTTELGNKVLAHNLPPQSTPFIGRVAELDALDKLIQDPQKRLVTVVGPGGFGKTRLVMAYAERLASTAASLSLFAEGIHFISLVNSTVNSTLSATDNISLTVLRSFGLILDETDGRLPKQQLLDYLKDKQLLLILDNFEQLLGGRMLMADILQVASQVQILITSRERLSLYEEQLFVLRGLGLPIAEAMHPESQIEEAQQAESVQFFVQAASRVQHDFEIPADEWPYLYQLCYVLGGIPLALELSAAWVDTLSVKDILLEIERGSALLESQFENMVTRHRSMWQILDYSWQRLGAGDQAVLAALSVFRGRFTRQAAQVVTGRVVGDQMPLRTLSTLVHKALLYYERDSDRYTIHELLRQFAAHKLAQREDDELLVHRAHADYFCELLAQYEGDFRSSMQVQALRSVETDIGDIRVAWQYMVTHSQYDRIQKMVHALFYFYDTRSWFQEGERLFREAAESLTAALTTSEIRILYAQLQARQGWFAYHLGHYQDSLHLMRESLATLGQLNATAESLFNFNYLGAILRHEKNYADAQDSLHQGLALAQQLGDSYQASISLNMLGQIAGLEGDREQARYYCQEALILKRQMGDSRGMTYSLTYLGRLAQSEADFKRAARLFEESMSISEGVGDQRGVAMALQNLGAVAYDENRFEDAFSFYQRSWRLFELIGKHSSIIQCLIRLGTVSARLGHEEQAEEYLREALQFAADAVFEAEMIQGILGMAHFQLGQSDERQIVNSLTGLKMIVQHPQSSSAQLAWAEQLLAEAAADAKKTELSDYLVPPSEQLTTFVRRWLAEV